MKTEKRLRLNQTNFMVTAFMYRLILLLGKLVVVFYIQMLRAIL